MVVAGAFAVAACGSDGGGSVEAFCAAVEELVPLLGEEAEDPFDTEDIEIFNQRLDEFQSAVEAVADSAPDEISEKTDLLLASTSEQFDVFREQIDDPTDQDQLEAAFENSAFDEESAIEIEEAQDAAQSYAEEECDIVFPE